MFISNAFAQTAPAAAAGGDISSSIMGMLPLMKRQKEAKALVDALAKGDEIVTAGGLLGRVTALSEGQLGLQIAPGVEVQVQRSAVAQVLPKGTIK